MSDVDDSSWSPTLSTGRSGRCRSGRGARAAPRAHVVQLHCGPPKCHCKQEGWFVVSFPGCLSFLNAFVHCLAL